MHLKLFLVWLSTSVCLSQRPRSYSEPLYCWNEVSAFPGARVSVSGLDLLASSSSSSLLLESHTIPSLQLKRGLLLPPAYAYPHSSSSSSRSRSSSPRLIAGIASNQSSSNESVSSFSGAAPSPGLLPQMLEKYASVYNKNGRIGIYTKEVSCTTATP